MTARPDEVVQRWAGLCVPSRAPSDTDMVTWSDYTKLSADLQSANARLAELSLERDAILDDLADHVRRLAAVLAALDSEQSEAKRFRDLAYELRANGNATVGDFDRAHRLDNKADGMRDTIDAIRRAAGGEGDANQGDGE